MAVGVEVRVLVAVGPPQSRRRDGGRRAGGADGFLELPCRQVEVAAGRQVRVGDGGGAAQQGEGTDACDGGHAQPCRRRPRRDAPWRLPGGGDTLPCRSSGGIISGLSRRSYGWIAPLPGRTA
ncbi:hypothetical protein GZL_08214 [Streptomyces sp. 769]|nr:hypothetical protein GZL_08214 [Streptomyces sp. 769]